MSSDEIREKFLSFFQERGHIIVPSSSLVPDDPSVLLTTAGMQQFKPYFVGKADPMKDFGSKNTVSIQKSFRTSDIDEVGDESHLTFFEMLGNFSFGGYFKKEAIEYAYDFIVKEMGLSIDYVSVFAGDPSMVQQGSPQAGSGQAGVPADEESEKIWKSLGIADIRKFGREDNFWGPTGAEGPCGPTTEIYVNSALRQAQGKPPVEVWNIVFNEFYEDRDEQLTKLQIPGVDTGMGFERLVMVAQNVPTIFETDLFTPLIALVPKEITEKKKRILADHVRGIAFLLSDGVRPSNKEAGYVLRRLMRRVILYEEGGVPVESIFDEVFEHYHGTYSELNREIVLEEYRAERDKFMKTLTVGMRELERLDTIDARSAFSLYESFGLPYEVVKELGGERAGQLTREAFDEEFKKHQEISRAGREKKFGGHGLLLDTGELKAGSEEELEKVTRLHTATHLLQQALRDVLGPDVAQRGSDITVERTRFDFSFPRKLTPEEIQEIENAVNQKIQEDLPVSFREMPKEEAIQIGALHYFREKYPDWVRVYFVGHSLEGAYSKELCGGPHASHTGEIGKLKIIKEEAVGAGVRRVRAIVGA